MHLCIFICWGHRQNRNVTRKAFRGWGNCFYFERERASELISSDRDLEMANFHRNMDELSTHLTRLRVYFENMADYLNEDTVNVPAHQCKREYTGMRGQPKLEVSKEQIQFLRELHFPWVRIAELLGISTKTLSRRRQEFQIEEEMNWSSAGNGELREIMQEIMSVTPGIGQTRMLGALHSRGIRVQRWKVREEEVTMVLKTWAWPELCWSAGESTEEA